MGIGEWLFIALWVFVTFGSFVAAIVLASRQEKQRTVDLQAIASDIGFAFSPQGDADLLQTLSVFHLFSQGHDKSLSSMLYKRTKNLDVAMFDYMYVTGSGKTRMYWNQSVICFRFAGPKLPTFVLRPRGFFGKITEWNGSQGIAFHDYPTFSGRFLLRGNDELAIRKLFRGPILDYCTGNAKLHTRTADAKGGFYSHPSSFGFDASGAEAAGRQPSDPTHRPTANVEFGTEGSGNILLFYKAASRINVQEARSFLAEGSKVLSLFCPSSALPSWLMEGRANA